MKLGQTSFVHLISKYTASVLGFLTYVYLARELGAEVLGIYFLLMAVLAWFRLAGTVGIETAIAKRLSEGKQRNEFLTAGLIMYLVIFIILSGSILISRSWLNDYLRGEIAYLLVPLILVAVAMAFVNASLKGQHKVHLASLLSPIDRVLRATLQIGLVLLGFELIGLVLGYISAMFVAAVVGLYYVSYRITIPDINHFKSLGSYAKYSWLTRLEGRAFSSADTIVLGFFVSSSLIGIYEIAWNVAAFLGIFSGSLVQTLFPEMSKISSEEETEEVRNLVNKALSYAGLFLIPGFVGAVLIGSEIMAIYSSEFRQGYTVLVILVGANLVFGYKKQMTNILNAIDRPDKAFRISLVFLITNLSLNVGLVYAYDWIGAAVATFVASVIALAMGYRELGKLMDIPLPVLEIGKQVISAFMMGGVIIGVDAVIHVTVPIAIVLVIAGASIYFSLYLAISPSFRNTVKRNLPVSLPFSA